MFGRQAWAGVGRPAGEGQRCVARARYGGPAHLQKVDSAYVVFVVGVVTCVVAVAART